MKTRYRVINYSILVSLLLTGCGTHHSASKIKNESFLIDSSPAIDFNTYKQADLHFKKKEKIRTLEDQVRDIEAMTKQFEENDLVFKENSIDIKQWRNELAN